MNRIGTTALVVATLFIQSACMSPSTAPPVSSAAVVEAEQERQKELVITTYRDRNARLQTAALPIRYANADLCGDRVGMVDGSFIDSSHTYEKGYRSAATRLGIDVLPTFTIVVDGSPAHSAGVQEGDVVVEVNGDRLPMPTNKRSARRVIDMVAEATAAPEYSLVIRRDGVEVPINVVPQEGCAHGVVLLPNDELNAFADGTTSTSLRGCCASWSRTPSCRP